MTHKTESAMSSPVTISGADSVSDVESAIGVSEKATLPEAPSNLEGRLFDLGDGDLRLMVNGVTLETHKYLINRFSRLKDRIRDNALTIESNEPGVEDFRNTFMVLYASVIEGPFTFDPITLTSALRIATAYDYPALRRFSIRHLQKTKLSAVERIRLAREFGLSSWEELAYVELCNRDEPMTKEEADVLGLDAFVHVARIREKEQRRRGKDVDAGMESDDECQMGEVPANRTNAGKGKKKKTKKPTQAAPESDSNEGYMGKAEEAATEKGKKGEVETIPKPSFIGVETTGTRWRSSDYNLWVADAPGCECTVDLISGYQCALPPCIATAIKHLQTQQLSHNTDISKLETTMEHVQTILKSLAATPIPHAEPDSEKLNQAESVEEEVRKWLTCVENGTTIAQAGDTFM